MTNRGTVKRLRVMLGVMAVLALTAMACGNATADKSDSSTTTGAASSSSETLTASGAVPGVTKDEIRFAAIGTKGNNPLGSCVLDCFIDGVKAYFAFRNNEGGVDGRKLVISTVLDDELAKNKEQSLKVISANDTFGVFDAALLASGYADLDEAGIPTYTWAINFTEMSGHQSIFGNTGVLCVSCVERSPVYAATLAKAKKIAVVGYGAAQVSKDCVKGQTEAIKRFSSETGQEVVYSNDNLLFGLPNGIGPEVTAMKAAGADLIISCWELNGAKTLEQELLRQGMGDIPQFSSNLYDADFIAQNSELFNGDIVRVAFRPFESKNVGALANYKKWMEKTGAKESEVSMSGWINADLAYQGLKAAGPNLDRAKVIAATNKMTAYSADGLVNPIDWSRQHTAPTEADPVTHGPARECYSFVRVKDGKFELIGDPAKPFACWDVQKKLEWSKPVASDLGG